MKIHVCFYLNGQVVTNINDVVRINFLNKFICVDTELNRFWFYFSEFDKIEVDYYD